MSLTAFQYTATVSEHAKLSACLGTNVAPFTDKDIGKAVKLAANNNYILCADNDELEGFVYSVEPGKKNSGYGFGSVQKMEWVEAEVIGGTSMVVGDYAVAGAQVAVGTVGMAKVKPGAPTKFLWRCYRILSGAGAAGSRVLLYRE